MHYLILVISSGTTTFPCKFKQVHQWVLSFNKAVESLSMHHPSPILISPVCAILLLARPALSCMEKNTFKNLLLIKIIAQIHTMQYAGIYSH